MNHIRSLFAISLASLILTGCAVNPGTTTTTTIGSDAAQFLYIAQNSADVATLPAQILLYPTGAPPSATPTKIITLPVGLMVGSIAADSSGNVYVATSADVREYAANAKGAATPIRLIPANTITTIPSAIGLYIPVAGLAVDSSGNLYVSESQGGGTVNGGVAIFSSTANGSVAPTRYITGSGPTTLIGTGTLIYPGPIAVDSAGNLYVSNFEGALPLPAGVSPFISVLVFGPTANGNVAPERVLNQQAVVELATDTAGNLYTLSAVSNQSSISPFAPEASGNAAPIRTLSLGFDVIAGFTAGRGDLYVGISGNYLNSAILATPDIQEFAPSASGTATPVTSFIPTGIGMAGLAAF